MPGSDPTCNRRISHQRGIWVRQKRDWSFAGGENVLNSVVISWTTESLIDNLSKEG